MNTSNEYRNIRPLKKSDRADILEIASKIWHGHDYLPYFFDAWLKDENSHTTAIEHDGHVVSLANLRVIENGRTGWMEGLRVHPDHRGKGLASIITKHVVELAEKIKVERIRYTTATDNESSLHLGKMVGMERKFDLAFYWHENPHEIKWKHPEQTLREVTSSDLVPDLTNSGLLPHNVIVYDWKALDATIEGLEKIGSTAKYWVRSEDDVINSFSLGFSREEKSGHMWSFTIYTNDEDSFLTHLSHHLRQASEAKCDLFFGMYPTHKVDTLYAMEWANRNEEDSMTLTLLERIL
ncbi:MAG: GNAT family N-acetyltransferase [Candidatus Thorarchaeota archaeon]